MIKIIGTRGSGKTTKLLEIAQRDGYVIVEPTTNAANYVRRIAIEKEYNVDIISSNELLQRQHGVRKEKYLVDELDMLLQALGIYGYSNGIE